MVIFCLKVSGSFDVGYRSLEFSTATKDYNSFGTTSSLAWEVTPKLRSTLNFSRNFDVSGAGSTFNANNFQLSNVYSINDEYKLSITLGYVDKEYRANPNRFLENLTREESLKNASVRLSYAPSRNLIAVPHTILFKLTLERITVMIFLNTKLLQI